jgi:hypothetical protein
VGQHDPLWRLWELGHLAPSLVASHTPAYDGPYADSTQNGRPASFRRGFGARDSLVAPAVILRRGRLHALHVHNPLLACECTC